MSTPENFFLVLPYQDEGGFRHPRDALAAIKLEQRSLNHLIELTDNPSHFSVDHNHPLGRRARHFILSDMERRGGKRGETALAHYMVEDENRRQTTLAASTALRPHEERTDTVDTSSLRWTRGGELSLQARLKSRFPGGGRKTTVNTITIARPRVLVAALQAGPPPKQAEWFSELCELDPRQALTCLKQGIPIVGGQAGQAFKEELTHTEMLPLLDHDNPAIRQRAITALSQLPEGQQPASSPIR